MNLSKAFVDFINFCCSPNKDLFPKHARRRHKQVHSLNNYQPWGLRKR